MPNILRPLWAIRNLTPVLLTLTGSVGVFVWYRLFTGSKTKQREGAALLLTILIFTLIDWGMLAALPIFGLSFGPVTSSLISITLVRSLALITVYVIFAIFSKFKIKTGRPWDRIKINDRLILIWVVNLCLLGAAIYTMYIEPFDLRISEIDLPGMAFNTDQPLRFIQLSDIHIERLTIREERILKTIEIIEPDLILLTGDYLNIDYKYDLVTHQQAREFFAQLSAPYGVYAVAGTRGVDPPEVMKSIFAGLDIQVLDDQIVQLPIPGNPLYLVGITHHGRVRDSVILQQLMETIPGDASTMLIYHTPDLIEAAVENKVDTYLAGHTHGGQVRLPFYGALVTMSYYGKQYESGAYSLGNTNLYVSRGLGMEGLGLPRLRFLCPPELVLINLGTPPQEASIQGMD